MCEGTNDNAMAVAETLFVFCLVERLIVFREHLSEC